MKETRSLEGKKIFFVEDDMFLANIISRRIKEAGGSVTHVTDGSEAVVRIPKETPHILLLDLLLPGGIDGFEVLEKIKADPVTKDVPVVIISNLDQPADIEKGMKLGAYRFLIKASVTPPEIVEHIAAALHSELT